MNMYSPVYTRPQSGLIRIQSTYGRGLPNPDWIRIASRLYSIRKRVNPDSTLVQRIV